MIHSYALAEPASACAYAMLDKDEPLAAAAAVTAGFHSEWPLAEHEADRLYPLIVLRLLLSVSLCAYQTRLRRVIRIWRSATPQSGLYWKSSMRSLPRWPRAHLRRACGLAACPAEAGAVSWLRGHAAEFARSWAFLSAAPAGRSSI